MNFNPGFRKHNHSVAIKWSKIVHHPRSIKKILSSRVEMVIKQLKLDTLIMLSCVLWC